jgi:hypothetical protein
MFSVLLIITFLITNAACIAKPHRSHTGIVRRRSPPDIVRRSPFGGSHNHPVRNFFHNFAGMFKPPSSCSSTHTSKASSKASSKVPTKTITTKRVVPTVHRKPKQPSSKGSSSKGPKDCDYDYDGDSNDGGKTTSRPAAVPATTLRVIPTLSTGPNPQSSRGSSKKADYDYDYENDNFDDNSDNTPSGTGKTPFIPPVDDAYKTDTLGGNNKGTADNLDGGKNKGTADGGNNGKDLNNGGTNGASTTTTKSDKGVPTIKSETSDGADKAKVVTDENDDILSSGTSYYMSMSVCVILIFMLL